MLAMRISRIRRVARKVHPIIRAAAPAVTGYTGVFHGTPDQVGSVRREVARRVAACPRADEIILVASELATNAVLHSDSQGQFFTFRCEVGAGYCRLEAEDLGGPWDIGTSDAERPHGLDIIETLAGEGNWGAHGDMSGRVVWARLEW
jgi:anti-sigma regulatory factor (Ser/Thr protein kinase)